MERVVILGRGAAGKSTAARELGRLTGLPVVELDEHFWRPGLVPMAPEEWARVQRALAAPDRWIMDGDLGAYDALAARLERADTVVILDFSLARCVWRAARRSRERADFWRWLVGWRWRSRPAVLEAVGAYAPHADVRRLHTADELRRFLATAATNEERSSAH